MPIRNVLLVKYEGGYHEVAVTAHSGRRREGSLSLAVGTLGETVQIATTFLLLARDPAEQVVAALEPRTGTDRPFVDFQPADLVTVPDRHGVNQAARVIGITLTEDAEGNPIWVPELDFGHDT